MGAPSTRQQDIVKKLIDAKAIDFSAISRVFSEVGPSLAVSDEPGDWFCGTNRIFIRVIRIDTPSGPVESLGELNAATATLRE
jgi:hypothetical protein